MTRQITLLVFRISTVPDYSTSKLAPTPDGVTAVALAGCMPDLRRRYSELHFQEGLLPTNMPSLAESPAWFLPQTLWTLLGRDGRLYVSLHNAFVRSNADQAFGIALPVLHGNLTEFLLKFSSEQEAVSQPDWTGPFFCISMGGEAYGFWGDLRQAESRLRSAPDVIIPETWQSGRAKPEGQSASSDCCPELNERIYDGRILDVLDEVPLLMLPYGGEYLDALVLSRHMSFDQVVTRLRNGLAAKVEIIEFQDDNAYEAWQRGGLQF
jgi:hypothetical protein